MKLNKKEYQKRMEIPVKVYKRDLSSSRFDEDMIIQETEDYKKVNMTNILKKIANSKSSKKKEK